jgi:hypothetical protein
MSMEKVARAFQILQGMEKMGVNILGGLSEAAKSFDALGKGMAGALKARGHETAAGVARVLPYVGAAYAGKKAYESGPAQRVRAWHQRRQYEKAMRQAQQGGYY